MPAYSDTCHVLSNKATQSLILSFWELNQGKSYAQMIRCFVQITQCISISSFSLYILVLCGELLCPVMSQCCTFFLWYIISSFVCTRPVLPLILCMHRLQSCATSDALQLLRHLCNHCVPSKMSLIAYANVEANCRST